MTAEKKAELRANGTQPNEIAAHDDAEIGGTMRQPSEIVKPELEHALRLAEAVLAERKNAAEVHAHLSKLEDEFLCALRRSAVAAAVVESAAPSSATSLRARIVDAMRKGADIAWSPDALSVETGAEKRQIENAIARLHTQKEIERVSRGRYRIAGVPEKRHSGRRTKEHLSVESEQVLESLVAGPKLDAEIATTTRLRLPTVINALERLYAKGLVVRAGECTWRTV
jgi:hypothetical protein